MSEQVIHTSPAPLVSWDPLAADLSIYDEEEVGGTNTNSNTNSNSNTNTDINVGSTDP